MSAYPFTIGIVKGLQLHDIRVSDDAHDLQFTILPTVSHHSRRRIGMLVTLNRLS